MSVVPRRAVSGRKFLAAARAPGRDHLASALGGHTGAESVPALADDFARLIGPLHESVSAICV